ncbi:MAG: ATP-binding protein [Clostridiales bacterium]|nr:ATP-binding protein [Clostridiales bacterium]
MKKLPIGIQTFREIIEEGYVYADKTEYIYNLVQGGKYYFLSRPRRFGKSLLLDTMKELFEGNKELFKGLWIDSSDFEWKKRPVIRIDMTQVKLTNTEALEESLVEILKWVAEDENVELAETNSVSMFSRLIRKLSSKYSERVVVLIDEYDKPIIDFIDDPERAAKNRELIGNFYGVLKGQDANLSFVFITGVSKFTKTSIFSKLNNLWDITMRAPYAGICGFTEAEFDILFGDERIMAYRAAKKEMSLPDGDKELAEIRGCIFDWYDGYTWDGETRVFNPFSLLNFFGNNEYLAYWYESGIPTFIPKIFKDRPDEYIDIQDIIIDEGMLNSFDIENAPLALLLFQTGFLTVHTFLPGAPPEYTLCFPNREVAYSFGRTFLESAGGGNPLGNALITGMRKALDAGEPEMIAEVMHGLYASIPYQLHRSEESYYQTVFLATMQFLGFRVMGEVSVSKGRVDGVIEQPNGMTYVIEFKYVADEKGIDAAIEKAFAQIEERGYAERYAGSRKTVFKVAAVVAGRGEVKVVAKPV